MPRIDDYKQARAISVKELSRMDPEVIARFSGARIRIEDPDVTALSINFLKKDISMSWPEMEFSSDGVFFRRGIDRGRMDLLSGHA